MKTQCRYDHEAIVFGEVFAKQQNFKYVLKMVFLKEFFDTKCVISNIASKLVNFRKM